MQTSVHDAQQVPTAKKMHKILSDNDQDQLAANNLGSLLRMLCATKVIAALTSNRHITIVEKLEMVDKFPGRCSFK